MPILSTHELAVNKNKLEYDLDEGWIHHKPTGRRTHFVQRLGVYFVQLFFKKNLTGGLEMDFQGPGRSA